MNYLSQFDIELSSSVVASGTVDASPSKLSRCPEIPPAIEARRIFQIKLVISSSVRFTDSLIQGMLVVTVAETRSVPTSTGPIFARSCEQLEVYHHHCSDRGSPRQKIDLMRSCTLWNSINVLLQHRWPVKARKSRPLRLHQHRGLLK